MPGHVPHVEHAPSSWEVAAMQPANKRGSVKPKVKGLGSFPGAHAHRTQSSSETGANPMMAKGLPS